MQPVGVGLLGTIVDKVVCYLKYDGCVFSMPFLSLLFFFGNLNCNEFYGTEIKSFLVANFFFPLSFSLFYFLQLLAISLRGCGITKGEALGQGLANYDFLCYILPFGMSDMLVSSWVLLTS